MTSRDRLTTIDSHPPHHPDHHQEHDEDEEIVETLPAKIFDAYYCGEPVPGGFDAVKILVDGGIKADLSWKEERSAAMAYASQGLRIFWEINLGLEDTLKHGIGNRMQFLGLSLSIEHFCKTLWREFYKDTVGLCLYRGSLDFSEHYLWDEEQVINLQEWLKDLFLEIEPFAKETCIDASNFKELTPSRLRLKKEGQHLLKFFCRDVFGEYLSLLASRIPDQLPLFLLLDATTIEDCFVMAQMLNKERYPRFHLAVKKRVDLVDTQFLGGEMAWEGSPSAKGLISRTKKTDVTADKAILGFCLPRMSICRPSLTIALRNSLSLLLSQEAPFRCIPEAHLGMEWDGLDYLIVDTQHVETSFRRTLKGFCAAGGKVVFIGDSLGLTEEIPFKIFYEQTLKNC